MSALDEKTDVIAFRRKVAGLADLERDTAAIVSAPAYVLEAGEQENNIARAQFICRVNGGYYRFTCRGLPSEGDFKWLILPEKFLGDRAGKTVPETAHVARFRRMIGNDCRHKGTLRSFAFGLTHVGNIREENQDSYFIDEDKGVFAVMDGAGGMNAGALASGS